MPKEEFWKKLQEARTPSHSMGHPFSNAWKNADLTKDHLGFWAMQQYYYIEEEDHVTHGRTLDSTTTRRRT